MVRRVSRFGGVGGSILTVLDQEESVVGYKRKMARALPIRPIGRLSWKGLYRSSHHAGIKKYVIQQSSVRLQKVAKTPQTLINLPLNFNSNNSIAKFEI